MISSKGRGFVYLLHPTPELWTLSVPHRTQILYLPDISFISAKLNLTPGKIVVESGTGSGSFSHSIARSVTGKGGHLYTFEYHDQRVEALKNEIELHNLSEIVTLNHRDVCKDGFDLENIADVVFLDLPAPWEAVPHAAKALKKSIVGKICSFSPCIEQVQKTALALNENGFFDIQMFEVLVRSHQSKQLILHDIQSAIDGKKVTFRSNKGRKRPISSVDSDNKPPLNDDHNSNNIESKPTLADLPDPKSENQSEISILASRFEDSARGHTSYLTFASLFSNQ
ncbi:tRNA (adenine(58)-N(1))-methyltransferase catalytic subunit TRM61 [Smittium mucronatum]|uniref:tRNA (adenine(58)-N(1))-methyltransferase catalytic subunit TRM61 n=1 Tax=Smittium mucronatum TaxID=133383 RepID=A0A1R0GL33_9FUNG|nr:tRNA (adenine(58)-N(1))-methyltransferase catalytic subunit TRM61 [Smittium mucronatum]